MPPSNCRRRRLLPSRSRAAAFDAERADLLARLEACAGPAPSEVYALQAENRKRAKEVRELQKASATAVAAAEGPWRARSVVCLMASCCLLPSHTLHASAMCRR